MTQLSTGKLKWLQSDSEFYQGKMPEMSDDSSSAQSFTDFVQMQQETSSTLSRTPLLPIFLKTEQSQTQLDSTERPKTYHRNKEGAKVGAVHQSVKHNYAKYLVRDIKTMANLDLNLKKKGSLPKDSPLEQQYLAYFSKGSKLPETRATLKLFLDYSPKENTSLLEGFSRYIQRQITEGQMLILSGQMREWLLERKMSLIKFAVKGCEKLAQKSQLYACQFMEDLQRGEVKKMSKRE